jgi:integrase
LASAAGRESGRHSGQDRLAHFPPHLCNALQGKWEDVKTVQELLRHANSLVTMNLYAQAVKEAKRQAQSRLVSMLLDDNSDKQSPALIGTKRTYEKIIQSRKLLI